MKYAKPLSRAVLCLDVGNKRIGLAYCDSLHITISILPAIIRSKDFRELTLLKQFIIKHNLLGIVVGLPLDDNGEMTYQAKDCYEYGLSISQSLKLPIAFVNEHSSTWETLNRFGIKKDKSGLVDSLSAKVILEQWINEGPELKEFLFK